MLTRDEINKYPDYISNPDGMTLTPLNELKEQAILAITNDCKHEVVYNTEYHRIAIGHDWICKKCGLQGFEYQNYQENKEYYEARKKFGVE